MSSNTLIWISFIGSLLSVILGISYIIYGFTIINVHPKGCDFFYCNDSWRMLITFAPERFIDTFQPMIMGGIGVIYALPDGFRPSFPAFLAPPSSSVLGGIFHIVMGLFTNLGYMSWFGITVATFNLLIGVSFILILAMRGRAAPRPKDVDELAGPKVVAVAVPVEVTGSA